MSTSTPSPFINSTCRDLGHDWQSTTSETYRRCSRLNCKATERLVEGRWIAATRRSRSTPQPLPVQMSLFEQLKRGGEQYV